MPGSSPGMTIEFFSYTPLPQDTESLETVIASEAKQSILSFLLLDGLLRLRSQ